jgi:hypothetical protein
MLASRRPHTGTQRHGGRFTTNYTNRKFTTGFHEVKTRGNTELCAMEAKFFRNLIKMYIDKNIRNGV